LGTVSGWLLGLVLVVAVALALAVAIVPMVVGGQSLTVRTASMGPALPAGSVAVVRPRPATEITVGDVVAVVDLEPVTGANVIRIHRVTEVRPGPAFVTKADAETAPDPGPVAATAVTGVLWYHVPYAGTLRDRLIGPVGLAILVGVALLAALVRPRARRR
jgi:signal peptidase